MKKLITLLLAVMMLVGLVACASTAKTETPAQTANTDTPAETTPAETTDEAPDRLHLVSGRYRRLQQLDDRPRR